MSRAYLEKSFRTNELKLLPLGDVHLGDPACDEQLFLGTLDYIKKTNDIAVLGMGDLLNCFDDKTEILTENGWKKYNKIKGLKVMTFNKEKNVLELQKPTHKVFYEYSGKLFHFFNKQRLDLMVTPGHRVLCQHHLNGLKVKTAERLFDCSVIGRGWNIPTARKYITNRLDFSIEFMELCGWVITEGHAEKRGNSIRYSISQSRTQNTKNYERIKTLINRLGYDYSERKREDGVSEFRITAKAVELKQLFGNETKRIPRLLLEQNPRLLLELYHTLISGDGTTTNSNSDLFFTCSEQLKDDFQELCLKLGWDTSVKHEENGFKGIFRIGIIKTKAKQSSIQHKEKIEYNGVVWCVTVPNSFIVVRRNNRIMITGNCATKHSVSDSYVSKKNPQREYDEMIDLLYPIKDKLIGLLIGNHEQRIQKESGVNLIKVMSKELGVPYLGWGVFLKLNVGVNENPRKNQSYVVYATHGASGSWTPEGKVRAVRRLSESFEADLYLMGHVHDVAVEIDEKYCVDKRKKMVKREKSYYVLTGHFLEYQDSYAEMKAMKPTKKGVPKIKLFGDRFDIHVSV